MWSGVYSLTASTSCSRVPLPLVPRTSRLRTPRGNQSQLDATVPHRWEGLDRFPSPLPSGNHGSHLVVVPRTLGMIRSESRRRVAALGLYVEAGTTHRDNARSRRSFPMFRS